MSRVWRTIGDLPFNSSGAGEDEQGALLDISLLSVLFTQRWMIQGLEDDFMVELMFSKTIMMFLHLHLLTSPPQPTVNLSLFTLIVEVGLVA